MAPARDNPPTPSPRPSRERWLRLGLPPAVSLLVHALLLGLIVLVGVGVQQTVSPRPRLAEIGNPTDSPEPASDPAPDLAAPLPDIQPSRATPPAARPPTAFTSNTTAPTIDTRAIGSLPAASLGTTAASLTDPSAANTPTASFAGLKAEAAGRIVYVVDASGAVVPTLTYIKQRLAQSIDRLAPTQRFEIIFFREPAADADDVEPRPRFANELVSATPATRARAAEWIDDIHAAGRSDPSAALEEALALKPDLVFLLSTSIQRTETDAGAERARVLQLLDDLNPVNPRTAQRPVVIKALQFLRPDPANLLRDIALLHGDGEGSYRLLTAAQLGANDPEPEAGSTPPANRFTTEAANRLTALEPAAWPVVFGLPTRDEREAVRDAAASVLDTLDRGAEADRDTRWKLLHQRATLFFAASREGGPDRELLARAATESVRGVLSEPGPDLERRLVQALCEGLAREPSPNEKDAPDLEGQALTRIADDARTAGHPGLAFRARLGYLLCSRDLMSAIVEFMGGEDLLNTPLDIDPRSLLLWGETMTRAYLQRGVSDPEAFAPLVVIGKHESLHPSPEVRRSLSWGRMAAAGDSFPIDWPRAPAHVALARAAVLAQNPDTRNEGLTALQVITTRTDADDETRAEALWQAAIVERDLAQRDDDARSRVAARLRQLVTDYPDSSHASDAVAAALALGTTDDGTLPDSTPTDFVQFALRSFPEHAAADRWRLGLAHRARGLPRLDILEQIPPRSLDEPDAVLLYLDTVNELAAQPDTVSVLERALAYTHVRGRIEWYALALRTAETCESADPARAAELYLALAQAPEDQLQDAGVEPSPDELKLNAGRALLASGRTALGVRTLTDLATRLERDNDRGELFWRAWAMVLQTLADSTDAEARAQGLAHATRLKLIDPALGGGDPGARIMDAMDRLDSAHEHDPAHGRADPG